MEHDDPLRPTSECARGANKVSFAQRKNLTANEPRVTGPTDQSKCQNYVIEPRPQNCAERDREQNARESHQNIDQPHKQQIGNTADIPGKRTYADADQKRKRYG